jgi:FemAB-related protein (PEP-CTERM system-associated)
MLESYSIGSLRVGGEADWDAFVRRHPEGTYCHLSAWRQVLEKSYDLPCYYLQIREHNRLMGILPLVHLRGPLAPNRLVSMPFLDRGGPLSETRESGDRLVDFALQLVEKIGAKGLDLRCALPREAGGGEETSRFYFLLRLADSEDELWKSIGAKVRNQVRKSEKAGLSSKVVPASQLPTFFRIFATNMRDLGSPTHSLGFFLSMLDGLAGDSRLYLTFDKENSPVAGGIAIRFQDSVTVPWASSLRSSRSDCPNHSLYWTVLRDAQADGARNFDFGRSSQGTGTFHFKKQWGSEIHPLIWTFLDEQGNREGDYYLKPHSNSAAVRVWRRLPLASTARLGPWIRRQLPN